MITLDEALQAHAHGDPICGPISDNEPPEGGCSWAIYDNDDVPGLCAYHLLPDMRPDWYGEDWGRLVGVVSYPNGQPHWTPA